MSGELTVNTSSHQRPSQKKRRAQQKREAQRVGTSVERHTRDANTFPNIGGQLNPDSQTYPQPNSSDGLNTCDDTKTTGEPNLSGLTISRNGLTMSDENNPSDGLTASDESHPSGRTNPSGQTNLSDRLAIHDEPNTTIEIERSPTGQTYPSARGQANNIGQHDEAKIKRVTCAFIGDGSTCIVEIEADERVWYLKELIKGERGLTCHIDQLDLYVAKLSGGNFLEASGPNALELKRGRISNGVKGLMKVPMDWMAQMDNVDFAFQADANVKKVHVLVDIPRCLKHMLWHQRTLS
ncbi:hypothetical protein DYB37_011132 [Aphanomyces astaci]|uniref:Crinkler effector protein N-terminal domain-containing protein n=1 Tax=Aphanomyces astaci TaxID=112090 RepID=A0A3R7BYS4_APHAT|nr:hypothetical protein DYB35_013194 [Aphanomyces astaci]RHZ27613.1 hypothetical protein DYB37_011132 [Aphanomyces astaci]